MLRAEERAGGEAIVVSPFRVTLGDEYQGTFTTLGAALRATRWLRLALLPEVDVRQGLGWGPVQLLEDEPRVEDGPGLVGGPRGPGGRRADAPCGQGTVAGGRRTCASTAARDPTRRP